MAKSRGPRRASPAHSHPRLAPTYSSELRCQTATSAHARFRARNREERGCTQNARNPAMLPLANPQPPHRIHRRLSQGPMVWALRHHTLHADPGLPHIVCSGTMRAYENGDPPPLRFRERWLACRRTGPCTYVLAGERSLSCPPENGRGGGPPFSQACIVPEHTIWCDPGVGEDRVVRQVPLVSGQRVPAIADHGPLTEAAVNAMHLGVREREHGGVARGLDMSPLFPVPGPKTCVRLVGVWCLSSCKHRTSTGRGPALCQGLGHRSGERRWRCGNF